MRRTGGWSTPEWVRFARRAGCDRAEREEWNERGTRPVGQPLDGPGGAGYPSQGAGWQARLRRPSGPLHGRSEAARDGPASRVAGPSGQGTRSSRRPNPRCGSPFVRPGTHVVSEPIGMPGGGWNRRLHRASGLRSHRSPRPPGDGSRAVGVDRAPRGPAQPFPRRSRRSGAGDLPAGPCRPRSCRPDRSARLGSGGSAGGRRPPAGRPGIRPPCPLHPVRRRPGPSRPVGVGPSRGLGWLVERSFRGGSRHRVQRAADGKGAVVSSSGQRYGRPRPGRARRLGEG